MTLDELRAAAPQAEWSVTSDRFLEAKYEQAFGAAAVLTLGGLPYDVRIARGWYGAYKLQLVQKAQQSNERVCIKIYEGMIADLESRLGPFIAANTEYKEESPLVFDGGPTRTTTQDAGKSSRYTLHSANSYFEATSRMAHASGELSTVGQYFVNNPLFGESMCISSFTIEISGKPPEFVEIPFNELKPLRTPSVGTMHNSLEGVTLPAGGVTIKARCRLARNTGGVGMCEYDPKPPSDISNAIFWRREELAFDITNLSPRNPVPLFTHLEFRLESGERLALGTPATPLAPDDIQWSSAQDSLPRLPSIRSNARPDEAKPDTATATVDCQVQADGSLACLTIDVAFDEGVVVDSYNMSRFTNAARENLQDRRAAATTKSGVPTRGRWVHFQIPLRLRHDSMEDVRRRAREIQEARKKRAEAQ